MSLSFAKWSGLWVRLRSCVKGLGGGRNFVSAHVGVTRRRTQRGPATWPARCFAAMLIALGATVRAGPPDIRMAGDRSPNLVGQSAEIASQAAAPFGTATAGTLCSSDADCADASVCTIDVCFKGTCFYGVIDPCCEPLGPCPCNDDGSCPFEFCCNRATGFCDPPPCPTIPTVSQWGLVVLTLLLLTGARVFFGRASHDTRRAA